MIRPLLMLLSLLVALPAAAASLEGRLWDLRAERFVSIDTLFERLPPGGWLLLGEQHDHPEHHAIQADWIERLATRDQLGPVAMEMLQQSQQPLLDDARGRGQNVTPEALNWQPGWDWALYEPVVRAALDHAPALVATDLSRDQQRQAYTAGAPEGELEPGHSDFMRDLLYDSHCGQLPASSLDGMRQVQLARDQAMATRLREYSAPDQTGVMITGSIHARLDLGIPRWLKRPAVSVLMIAVEPDKTSPQDYRPEGLGTHPVADYLLFTSALPARDYCAELKAKPANN